MPQSIDCERREHFLFCIDCALTTVSQTPSLQGKGFSSFSSAGVSFANKSAWEQNGRLVFSLKTAGSVPRLFDFLARMQLLRVAWALAGAALCCFVILLIHSRFLKEGNGDFTCCMRYYNCGNVSSLCVTCRSEVVVSHLLFRDIRLDN